MRRGTGTLGTVVFLVAWLTVQPGGAAAQELLEVDPFDERFSPLSPVSGAVVVGLLRAVRAGTETARPRFGVHLGPSDEARDFCIDVMSRDGRYQANGSFTVERLTTASDVELDIAQRSSYQDELRSFGHDELAVLVREGPCAATGDGRAFVSSWRTAEGGAPTDAIVLVNAIGADAVAAVVRNEARTIGPNLCARTEGGRNLGFDHRCELDLSGLTGGAELLVLRQSGGQPLPAARLPILIEGR